MLMKEGIGYDITDQLTAKTGNSSVTLSDIVVSDIIMDFIFDKSRRSLIKGYESMPITRNSVMNALDELCKEDSVLDMSLYKKAISKMNDLVVELSNCQSVVSVIYSTVRFITKEGLLNSFCMIRVDVDNGEAMQTHYIVPVITESELNLKDTPMALLVDGNGEVEIIELPMKNSFSGYKTNAEEIANIMIAKKAYALYNFTLIQHSRLLVLPVYAFQMKYNKLTQGGSFTPAEGLGFALTNDNQTLVASLADNITSFTAFDVAEIAKSGKYLLLYDNRTYTDKLLEERPIEIEVLSDTEVSYSGFYFNGDYVEPLDEMYAEADLSSKAGRIVDKAKKLPKTVLDKAKSITSKLREFMVQYRKAKDDQLRERVINDEFVPLLDDSLKWIIGGATSLGMIFVVGMNPLLGLIGGYVAKSVKAIHDKETRERVLKILKDELVIIDEKIGDARGDGNKSAKYALIRTRQAIERKLESVITFRKLG